MKQKKLYHRRWQKFILFFLLLIPFMTNGQAFKLEWDFPVKPGTKAWEQLENNAQKVSVCQIPEEIVSMISTPNLLNLCLKYPLLSDVFAFNNINEGFLKFENDFNGFRELLKRGELGIELINLYKINDPDFLKTKKNLLERGQYAIYLSEIELFLSHPKVIEKFSVTDKKKIIEDLFLKKKIKNLNPSWYKSLGIQTSYLAMYNILETEDATKAFKNNNSQILPYIKSGIIFSNDILNQFDIVLLNYIYN